MVRTPSILKAGFALAVIALSLACSHVESPVPPLTATPKLELQGLIVVEGLGACGHCHSRTGEPDSALSGGRIMEDEFGEIAGPNITLAKTGIGAWSENDLIRIFRGYVKPGGGVLSSTFHSGSEWMSDIELAGVTTYLRSLPPVENEVPARNINWLDRNTTGFFDRKSEVKGLVPQISRAFRVEYGQYLVDSVAHCGSCHSMPEGIISSSHYMVGGQTISFDGEEKVAPNITSDPEEGLGKWSENDYRVFFTDGRTPDGRQVDTRFCPVKFYSRVSQEDLDLMIAYLRTIPAD